MPRQRSRLSAPPQVAACLAIDHYQPRVNFHGAAAQGHHQGRAASPPRRFAAPVRTIAGAAGTPCAHHFTSIAGYTWLHSPLYYTQPIDARCWSTLQAGEKQVQPACQLLRHLCVLCRPPAHCGALLAAVSPSRTVPFCLGCTTACRSQAVAQQDAGARQGRGAEAGTRQLRGVGELLPSSHTPAWRSLHAATPGHTTSLPCTRLPNAGTPNTNSPMHTVQPAAATPKPTARPCARVPHSLPAPLSLTPGGLHAAALCSNTEGSGSGQREGSGEQGMGELVSGEREQGIGGGSCRDSCKEEGRAARARGGWARGT